MKINNEFYQSHGHTWWADDAEFDYTGLRYCVNPVRFAYFKRKLRQLSLPGKSVLDVGCGGGFLSEEFARDGYNVSGIDPASASIQAAKRHAVENDLHIDYRVGRGEAIPFPDGSFDIVACCDVLEHVDDPGQVIREVSRTLKEGGVFLYDTLNRTWFSKIAAIKIWQDWAHLAQPNTHVWRMFIKPAELVAIMAHCGLVSREMRGIAPRRRNPFSMLWTLHGIRKGRLRKEEMAARLGLCESESLALSYMGFAVKQGELTG